MPELTERELKILTRPRLSPWVGVAIMVLNAALEVMSGLGLQGIEPMLRFAARVCWAFAFLLGLLSYLLANKWALERERVLESLRGKVGFQRSNT